MKDRMARIQTGSLGDRARSPAFCSPRLGCADLGSFLAISGFRGVGLDELGVEVLLSPLHGKI